jgi:rifampicin phosphotransferase
MPRLMGAVLWLSEIRDEDRGRVGAKAYSLALLGRQGLPVPEGFVLPADAEVHEAFPAYARLGGDVAVRSSSTAEDLEESSFAGQYKTVLGVRGPEALAAAVRECRESERAAAAYAELVGVPGGRLAVLVQRMVEPRAAGVVFTRHPNDEDRLLVEAHAGLGDAVVSGTAAPDRYVVDRRTRARVFGPDAGCLDPAELAAVSDLALRVEELAGAPRDVEWALGPRGPVLLQSRPITVDPEDVPDLRLSRLTRANVGEVLPDPVTPLTWSTVGAFLEQAFRSVARDAGLLPRDSPPFLVLYRRRLYLNLSLSVNVAAGLPGVSPEAAEALLLGGGSGAVAAPAPSASALGVLLRLLRLLRLAHRLPRQVDEAARSVDGLPGASEIDADDERRLAERLDRFAETGYGVARAHVGVSGACGFRLAVLARLVDRFRPGKTAERVNRLVANLQDVASVAPALALEALAAEAALHPDWLAWLRAAPSPPAAAPPALRERLRAFLGRFGHRAVAEGELFSAAWEDDPEPPLAALRALVRAEGEASFRRRAAAATRDADETALLSGAGALERHVLRWALSGARAAVRERERTKELSVRLVHHGRRLVRAAGRRLVARGRLLREDDAFFLALDELRRALRGGSPSRALLARRRRRHEREGKLDAPREVHLGAPLPEEAPAGMLRGTGVSAGVGAGPARVLRPGEPIRLDPGDVLVARVLDAAYGPALAVAAGAVTEIGGLLSHGAVVARELGVPCVVDVRGATRAVRTGEHLVVDGGSGLVTRAVEADAGGSGTATGPALRPALEPEDTSREALHPLEEHPLARESVYLNVQDPERRFHLVASAAVRAGGRGEALVALRLEEGPLLFGLELRPADLERGLAVGGIRVDWHPFRIRLKTRLAPHDPASFPPALLPLLCAPRTVDVRLDLELEPTTPAIDFCRGLPDDVLEALAPLGAHHLEQSGAWRGFVEVDGARHHVHGTGSRDHSWGRRSWDAADHWRLFTTRLLPRSGGDEVSLHALAVSVRGRRIEGGFLTRGDRAERIARVLYAPDDSGGVALRTFELRVVTERGETVRLRGTVARTLTVPVDVERRLLRHLAGRPYRLLLQESFTRYEADGALGYGMAETTLRPS